MSSSREARRAAKRAAVVELRSRVNARVIAAWERERDEVIATIAALVKRRPWRYRRLDVEFGQELLKIREAAREAEGAG